MHRSSRLGALAALALLSVAACSGADRSDDDVVDDLSIELQTGDLQLSSDDADCVAEALVDELGAEAVDEADFNADAPPDDEQEEFAAAVQAALDDCSVDLTSTDQ